MSVQKMTTGDDAGRILIVCDEIACPTTYTRRTFSTGLTRVFAGYAGWQVGEGGSPDLCPEHRAVA